MNKGLKGAELALGLLLSKSLEVLPPHSFTAKILWYGYNDALNQSSIMKSYIVSSILTKDNAAMKILVQTSLRIWTSRLYSKFLEVEFQVIELCTL